MPKRYFNIAGPCVPGEHYMLDPLRGISDELMELIDSKQYFVIHAARQSGKTTLLLGLVDAINAKGDYYALYCSLETVQVLTEPATGIPAIVDVMERCIKNLGLPQGFAQNADRAKFADMLNSSLVDYCRTLDKPLVVFFDEADCLSNGTMITFLRQLRDGYVSRGRVPFVRSVALVGMRNIRDYKAHIRSESETLGSTSPFNIVTESFNLRNFTKAEVAELYGQHTSETGQTFEPQAADYVFERTQGQPWLVNAIARECVEKITRKNYSIPITKDLAEQAIQNIILQWGTHFDSLLERLKERRVRRVISPLILGDDVASRESDDYLFTRDLGLIREIDDKTVPANPIYAELIVRFLGQNVDKSIASTHKEFTTPRYLKNGKFDMDYLIKDFQTFWQNNSDHLKKHPQNGLYEYHESTPYIVMQTFMHRIVVGGGQVLGEMALGKKRTAMCLVYDGQKYPIELKILQNERNRADSLTQILTYMDKTGSDAGWLVVFDRDDKKPWDEKIYMKKENVNGKNVTIAGC